VLSASVLEHWKKKRVLILITWAKTHTPFDARKFWHWQQSRADQSCWTFKRRLTTNMYDCTGTCLHETIPICVSQGLGLVNLLGASSASAHLQGLRQPAAMRGRTSRVAEGGVMQCSRPFAHKTLVPLQLTVPPVLSTVKHNFPIHGCVSLHFRLCAGTAKDSGSWRSQAQVLPPSRSQLPIWGKSCQDGASRTDIPRKFLEGTPMASMSARLDVLPHDANLRVADSSRTRS